MKCKVVVVIISLMMLFAFSVPAAAIVTDNFSPASTATQEEIAFKTTLLLQVMEPEKEQYGLAGVDFSSLYLGNQLPAYIVGEDSVTQSTEILYYPIMSEDDWVATAMVTTDAADNLNVQISTKFAEEYSGDGAGDEVALIFDNNGAYIANDAKVMQVAEVEVATPGRESLQKYSIGTVQNVEKAKLDSTYALQPNSVARISDFDNQWSLDVPSVKQAEGSKQCWAACIASICKYYGKSATIDSVYTKAGIAKYNGADTYDASDTLEAYGFDVTWKWRGSYNWYQLRTAIFSKEAPIFASCNASTGSSGSSSIGHAVVIRGFYVYKNVSQVGIITYMDPDVGRYVSSTVATDKNFNYVSADRNVQYYMNIFLEVEQ